MKLRVLTALWLSLVLLTTGLTSAWTQDPNASVVQGSATGTPLPITGAVTSTVSGSVTANQGVAGVAPWLVDINNWLPYPWQITFNGVAQPVTAAQSGSWTVGISGTPVVLSSQNGTWTVGVNNFPASFGVTQGTSPWIVDGSGVIQPVSGTFWQATQPISGTITANAGSGTFTVGGTVTANQGTSPWVVDGSGVTQPVSGTITANAGTGTFTVDGSGVTQPISASALPLPTGAATDATVAGLNVAQNTFTSGQKGPLVQGAVSASAPSYSAAKTNPLSLNMSGGLRVDGSGVTQPVSGTVTANAGSGTFSVGGVQANGSGATTNAVIVAGSDDAGGVMRWLAVSPGGSLFVSGNTSQGSAVGTEKPFVVAGVTGPSSLVDRIKTNGSGMVLVDGSNVTQPVSGTVTANAGTGTFTVDGSGHTQPVSGTVTANAGSGTFTVSGTVTANAGTGTLDTNVKQINGTTADTNSGSKSAGTLRVVLATDQPQLTNALKVDGSAVTQPISATALPLPTGAATNATVAGLNVAQDTFTSGQSGPLVQGAVSASAPSYSAAKTNPLSLTTSGGLRVDGSGVTQPVSGTVTANAGTGTFGVGGVQANASAATTNAVIVAGSDDAGGVMRWLSVSPGGALFVSGNTSQGSAIGTEKPFVIAGVTGPSSLVDRLKTNGSGMMYVDGSLVTQPVSGTFWQATQPVSAASLPLPTGAATETTLATLPLAQGSTTSGQSGPLAQGAVTTAAPSYTTAKTSPFSLNTSGGLRVDGSGVTQPVSGTVTANAGSGTFTVAGGKTNNNAAPGATNIGTLSAVATAAAPSSTEGNLVALSTDLAGNLRTTATATVSGTVTVAGNKTNNNAAPGATNIGALPAVANAATQTYTEGNQTALSQDLNGRQRVVRSNKLVTVTATITRPANTTAYTINDCISDSTSAPTVLTFSGCAAFNGGSGQIVSVQCIDGANAVTPLSFMFLVFDTAPTAINDNAAFALSQAQSETIVGEWEALNGGWTVLNTGSGSAGRAAQALFPTARATGQPLMQGMPFVCTGSSTSLFAMVQALNAYTPVSAEKFVFRLIIQQD